MAKRLATEYVKTCLRLSEADMPKLIRLFQEQRMTFSMKVYENGNQEMVLSDESGDEVLLTFELRANLYVCEGAFCIRHARLTDVMHKAVSMFKGDAVVHRLYHAFTMIYEYERGSVAKIVEKSGGRHKVIYEYKNTIGRLEELFRSSHVENEITHIQENIDRLLDLRNMPAPEIEKIDSELAVLARKLFKLEA